MGGDVRGNVTARPRSAGDVTSPRVSVVLPTRNGAATLPAPPRADAALAGTFPRQRPRPAASAITRHYLARWMATAESGHVAAVASRADFAVLDPMERLRRCTFDNVCSCIRRSVWTRFPFKATPIAEDLEWARDVLLAGHRLAYVPRATVIHSHDRSARYEFTRTYLLHRRLFELFEVRTIPTLPALARAIATSLALHLRCVRGDRAVSRAIALAFAWPLGQYLGALSAMRGWKPFRSRM